MFAATKRWSLTALAGLAVTTLFGSEANAQRVFPFIRNASAPAFQVFPDPRVQQAAANVATLGQAYQNVPPYALGYNPYALPVTYPVAVPGAAGSPYISPYYATLTSMGPAATMTSNPYMSTGSLGNEPYPNYGAPYSLYPDPLGGYLRGAADVINSQSRFMKGREEAALLHEHVRQARLQTRRLAIEEWKRERELLPTLEEERERALAQEVRRSQNNPTNTEVLSGQSLNTLLDHAAKLQRKNTPGPTITIGDDVLSRVNVSTAKGGNVGLLKNSGELTFPPALLSQAYEPYRKHLKEILPNLVKDAKAGKVDQALLLGMSNDLEKMRDQLGHDVFDLSPRQYIEALRFVRQMEDAVRVLRDPDVANYFNKKFAVQGKNVAEIVKYMAENGLRFAPAVPGDEASYLALHHALSRYDVGLQERVAKD